MLSLIINFPCSLNKACLIGGFFLSYHLLSKHTLVELPIRFSLGSQKCMLLMGRVVKVINGYYYLHTCMGIGFCVFPWQCVGALPHHTLTAGSSASSNACLVVLRENAT